MMVPPDVAPVPSAPPPIYLQASAFAVNAITVQAMGKAIPISAINPSIGIKGNSADRITSFKKIADPANPRKHAYLFQVAQRDPDTFSDGAKRAELTWSPATHGYQLGVTYWTAFRVRISDNVKNAPAGDQVILWQIHDASGEGGLSPNMALVAYGGGASAELAFQLRFSSSPIPSLRDNVRQRTMYTASGAAYPTNAWTTFVVQFKLHHTDGNGAFCKLWRDGELVAHDTEPNDYNAGQEFSASKRSYQKLGIYHFTPKSWKPGEIRTVLHKGVVSYREGAGIDEPLMRRMIEAY